MNKGELIKNVSLKTGLTKKASEDVLNAIIDCITDSLANGERVQITGFGTFEIKERAERVARNPKENTQMTLPAAKVAHFKAGKHLTDKIKD